MNRRKHLLDGSLLESKNAAMGTAFFELASLVQKSGSSSAVFKSRAFRNVGKIISEFPQKITSASDLKGIKGVGKGSLEKVEEYIKTGKISEMEDLKKPAEVVPNKASADAFKYIDL